MLRSLGSSTLTAVNIKVGTPAKQLCGCGDGFANTESDEHRSRLAPRIWAPALAVAAWLSGRRCHGAVHGGLPEQNTVVAFFSLTDSMQRVLDLLWEHLLPALGSSALPDGDSDEALTQRLKALSQPTASERLGSIPFSLKLAPSSFFRLALQVTQPTRLPRIAR